MSEIGFYHLQRWPLEKALPKLLERVLERGHRAVLLAGSQERLAAANGWLWTYEPNSWLPHGTAADGEPQAQPVFLTTAEENPNGADVLVCIDGVAPGFLGDFARVLDMLDGRDDAAVEAARGRWQRYRAAGHSLTYWQQTDSGGWERKG